MGDKLQEPNFTQTVDVIYLLVRSCFTRGIKRVQQYSPESVFQEEDQHIDLMLPELGGSDYTKFPLMNSQCFTNDLLLKALPNNDSLMLMVVHVCWGDPETSIFFMNELVDLFRTRRSIEDLQYP